MLTISQIKTELGDMGIRPADTVMVHSSLRAIGPTKGRGDGLIDAFLEYLSEGLLLIPTHTWANVNREQPVFDVRKTLPCIGTLPRLAMSRADGIRSLHPTHSIWACGRGAEDYVRGEELLTTPAPPAGAWARLADVGAKILLIGVGHERNTFIHSVDELVDYPDRLASTGFDTVLVDGAGTRLQGYMRPHHCSRVEGVSEYYGNFEKPLRNLGAETMGKLGNATVRIVDAKKCREIIARIYSRATSDIFTEKHVIPEEWYL